MKMAVRIRDRAIRRAGELLSQVNGKGNNQHVAGSDGKLSRRQVAADAGMSERQQLTAIRIAAIPQEEFDRQVDSAMPGLGGPSSGLPMRRMPLCVPLNRLL
jgi:hypothetical protein